MLINQLGDAYIPKPKNQLHKSILALSLSDQLFVEQFANSTRFVWCKYLNKKYVVSNGHILFLVISKPIYIDYLSERNVPISQIEPKNITKLIPTVETYKKPEHLLKTIEPSKHGYILRAQSSKCVVSINYWNLICFKFVNFKAYIFSEAHTPVILEQNDEFFGLLMPLRITNN